VPEPDDTKLKRLAAAVTLPPAAFGEIYDGFVTQHGGSRFMVLKLMNPAKPILEAFRAARDAGFFPELSEKILLAGGFPKLEGDNQESKDLRITMHAVVDASLGFLDARDLKSGVLTALRRVCKIEIDTPNGVNKATGFLIGPQAVLTAWHAIAPLLDATGSRKPDSHKSIAVHFDQVGLFQAGVKTGVMEDWLAGSSKKHALEDPTTIVLDFDTLPAKDFDRDLDYAILRLDRPVGRERGFYSLNALHRPCVDRIGSQLTLFQHPGGAVMKIASGVGKSLWPPAIETRLRHTANATMGSSGGLLLDAASEPVALHQCGLQTPTGAINGAIPTACIAAKNDNVSAVIGLDPIWQIEGSGKAVVGREPFQRKVLEAIAGHNRILVVRGDPKSGKTFSLDILRTMLGNVDHVVSALSASDLPNDAFALARLILGLVMPVAEVEAALPQPDDGTTAINAWIRDFLYPAVIGALKTAAGRRTIWIVIDDLDLAPPVAIAVLLFGELLFSDIEAHPFLRFVLIGQTGLITSAPARLVAYDDIASLGMADVEAYILRRATANGWSVTAEVAHALAMTVEAAMRTDLPGPSTPKLGKWLEALVTDAVLKG